MLSKESIQRLKQFNQNSLVGGRTTAHYIVSIVMASHLPVRKVTTNYDFSKYWESVREGCSTELEKLCKVMVIDKEYILELTRNIQRVRCKDSVNPVYVFYEILPLCREKLDNMYGSQYVDNAFMAISNAFPDYKELLLNGDITRLDDVMMDRLYDSASGMSKAELNSTAKAIRGLTTMSMDIASSIQKMDLTKYDSAIGLFYGETLSNILGLTSEESVSVIQELKKSFETTPGDTE